MTDRVHQHIVSELQQGARTDTIFVVIGGLLKLYADQQVDGYYDPALLRNYGTRYSLFILAVVCMGAVAIVVPLLLR